MNKCGCHREHGELGTVYDWHGDVTVIIEKDELLININNSYDQFVCKIYHCPFCGRKLGE